MAKKLPPNKLVPLFVALILFGLVKDGLTQTRLLNNPLDYLGQPPELFVVSENPDVQPSPPPPQPKEPLFPFNISGLKPGQCFEPCHQITADEQKQCEAFCQQINADGLKPCLERCNQNGADGQKRKQCEDFCHQNGADGLKQCFGRCHQNAVDGQKQCEDFCPLSAGDGEWKAWIEQIWFKGNDPTCPMEMKKNVFSFIFCPPNEKSEDDCAQSDEGIFVCYQSKLDPENKIASEIFQVPSVLGELDTRCNAKTNGGQISENVDPVMLGKMENSGQKMHGFRVAASGDGKFYVETSFLKNICVYDVKDVNACLKLEMFPDGGNLFWSQAYAVNPNGTSTPVKSNAEIEGVKMEEADGNNGKKKLANEMPLSAKCFLMPWLLGADIFFQYKSGPMYLKTMRKEKNAVGQCLPQMASYSSSQIVPTQICKGPEICEFDDSVWEVAKPGKYWNRVTIDGNKINIEFLNGNNDQLDLAIAVPNPHQFVLKVEELSGASPECWDGQDDNTCSKSPMSFEFNFNNNNDPDCKIRYSSGLKFTCMNMNGTDNLNNVDDRNYIFSFTFNGTEVLQEDRNRTNLIMPQKCAVNNQPIEDFGSVLGFTNNKFVMHFTLMPFALPTFKDDGADRGESDENDCPRAGMPFSLGFYPNKGDNTDKLKYDLLIKKKSEKKEEDKKEGGN